MGGKESLFDADDERDNRRRRVTVVALLAPRWKSGSGIAYFPMMVSPFMLVDAVVGLRRLDS